MISQLTVFLQNEKGRLAAACRTIADAGINMHSLFLADTQDFGVVRMLVDQPKKAAEALRAAGYRATITPVTAVRIPNQPGGLKTDEDIELESKLAEAGFQTVAPEEIYKLD